MHTNPQPSTLNPQPSTLELACENPQPSHCNAPQSSTIKLQCEKRAIVRTLTVTHSDPPPLSPTPTPLLPTTCPSPGFPRVSRCACSCRACERRVGCREQQEAMTRPSHPPRCTRASVSRALLLHKRFGFRFTGSGFRSLLLHKGLGPLFVGFFRGANPTKKKCENQIMGLGFEGLLRV